MSYPSYPEMRDSGVEWLGDVPAHWSVIRLKHCTILINKKCATPPDNIIYIGLENITSKTGQIIFSSEAQHIEGACNLFKAGDVLFGKLRPYLMKVFLASFGGACSAEILVLRPIKVNNRFLLYYLLSNAAIQVIDAFTYGAKMPRANWEDIGNLSQTLPSLTEQRRIAAFLDAKTAQIDELVALKERQVALLLKQRQALISHAVTKGLDPHAPMRDSGVEWLGEVPMGWKTMRLKFIAKIKYGLGQPPTQLDDGVPLIRATNIDAGHIRSEGMMFVDPSDVPYERNPVLRVHDIIVVRSGVYTGDSATIPDEYDGAIAGYDMVVRVVNALPQFVAYGMLSLPILENQINVFRMRAAQPHLNAEELGECLFFLPPFDTQNAIVAYLDRETRQIDSLVAMIRRQVERLRVYRQALISVAVTGKIDVRTIEVDIEAEA